MQTGYWFLSVVAVVVSQKIDVKVHADQALNRQRHICMFEYVTIGVVVFELFYGVLVFNADETALLVNYDNTFIKIESDRIHDVAPCGLLKIGLSV